MTDRIEVVGTGTGSEMPDVRAAAAAEAVSPSVAACLDEAASLWEQSGRQRAAMKALTREAGTDTITASVVVRFAPA